MTSPATVVLVGALDTKAAEYGFVRDRLASAGIRSVLLDTGVLGIPGLAADISREEVAIAGATTIAALASTADRNQAVIAMARGAVSIVTALVDRGSAHGVMALGGSNAAFVMTRVAAALPLGIPKMLVSTSVATPAFPTVAASDLVMMSPIEDIAGLTSVTAPLLARAADALAGMVHAAPVRFETSAIGSAAITMFGITTAGASAIRDRLVAAGREVHVFHANGAGGRALESLVPSGAFDVIVDLTTTELADEMLGGVCTAGPDRVTAAARHGTPQVVSVGALDVVNFGPRETVPDRYRSRRLHSHNPDVTLMRTTPEECAQLGRLLAERLNASTGHVEVHIPGRGFSQLSVEGGPLHDPAADASLVEAVRSALDERIPFNVHDLDINSREFAAIVAAATERILTDRRATT